MAGEELNSVESSIQRFLERADWRLETLDLDGNTILIDKSNIVPDNQVLMIVETMKIPPLYFTRVTEDVCYMLRGIPPIKSWNSNGDIEIWEDALEITSIEGLKLLVGKTMRIDGAYPTKLNFGEVEQEGVAIEEVTIEEVTISWEKNDDSK